MSLREEILKVLRVDKSDEEKADDIVDLFIQDHVWTPPSAEGFDA